MNDPDLHVLAYLSSAVKIPTQDDLDDILAHSRRNNEADGITGLLLHHDGNFFQVLEGPKSAVEACYQRIAKDPRHRGQILLLSEDASSRQFSEWTMAYIPFAKMSAADRKGFLDLQALQNSEMLNAASGDGTVGVFVKTFIANFRHG